MLMMFTIMVMEMGVSPTAFPIRCKFRYIARNTRLCRISTVLNVKVFLSLLLPQSQAIVVITMPVILFFVGIFLCCRMVKSKEEIKLAIPARRPNVPPVGSHWGFTLKGTKHWEEIYFIFLLKPRFTLTGRPGQARQHPVGLPWLKPNHWRYITALSLVR